MPSTGFKEDMVSSYIVARNQSWTPDQPSTDIGDDGPVEVWSDNDIELMRFADQLIK